MNTPKQPKTVRGAGNKGLVRRGMRMTKEKSAMSPVSSVVQSKNAKL